LTFTLTGILIALFQALNTSLHLLLYLTQSPDSYAAQRKLNAEHTYERIIEYGWHKQVKYLVNLSKGEVCCATALRVLNQGTIGQCVKGVGHQIIIGLDARLHQQQKALEGLEMPLNLYQRRST
jgi:hypothetical protein